MKIAMETKLLATVALVAALSTVFPNTAVADKSTPIEDKAIVDVGTGVAQLLAAKVREHGYDCASISSAQSFILGEGYTLKCNNYRYVYEIANKGGRVDVSVK